MAIAAKLMNVLNFNDVCYLSDCSQLVQFLNAEDHSHPPDWRMKAFTQIFDNCVINRQAKVHRISRALNFKADELTGQTFSVPVNPSQPIMFCSFSSHGQQCPLGSALDSVSLDSVSVIAAACC
jgi:hypothetical protein